MRRAGGVSAPAITGSDHGAADRVGCSDVQYLERRLHAGAFFYLAETGAGRSAAAGKVDTRQRMGDPVEQEGQ